jgi:hypothetical protein
MLLAWAGMVPEAHAQWQAKSSRDPMPATEVERPLALPRGWIQLDFSYEQHMGLGEWTSDGQVEKFEHVGWNQYTEKIRVAYGVSRHAELWWEIPFVQGRLVNDRWPEGTDIFDSTLGDQRFGWRLSLLRTEAPASSLILDTWYKAPTAKEAPGNYIGGPLNQQHLILTTGTADWYIGAAYKRQFGPLGLVGRAGWLHRFSGVVQYLVELNELQFSARIKPGDQARVAADVFVQLGPVALFATPEFEYRLVTSVGTTSKGFLTPNKNLVPVADSDGYALDLKLQAKFNITRGFDVVGWYTQPLLGQDLDFFPIEDLHPTWGPDFGGRVETRF